MTNNPERAFLHDISSPLATMQLVLETVLDEAKNPSPASQAEVIKRLEQTMKLVDRMRIMIQTRREILIKESAQ